MAKPKDKQPWFKFYPQDWRGDAKLRMCSIGARGLWAEMLCVMHEAEPYGYLLINGHSVSARQMAGLAGVSQGECMKYMLELASAGVYSLDEDKTIFSRRMVRDKEKSEKAKEWGKGGGNPDLMHGDNGRVNPKDKPQKPSSNSIDQNAAADARALDEMGLESERMLIGLLSAVATSLGRKPPDMRIIRVWLLDGISTATISATATPMIKRKADMASLSYCDAAVREAHAKDTAPAPNLQVVTNKKIFVEVGTLGWSAWDHHSRSTGGRGWPVSQHRVENVLKDGFWFDSEYPPGYDEATGERIPPTTDEAAA